MSKYIMVALLSIIVFSSSAQEFRSSAADFKKMADYLSKGSGKWMAPYVGYDPDNGVLITDLGLWFDLRTNDKVLHLSIVAYRNDTAHVVSDAMLFWHPGERRIKYLDINYRGILADGEAYFNQDNMFVTRNFTFLPNGEITFSRGENYLMTEDAHYTQNLVRVGDKWEQQGSNSWKRVDNMKGYSVIRHY